MRAVLDALVPHRCLGCDLPVRDPGMCSACLAETATLALARSWVVDLGEGVRSVGAYAYTGPVAAAVRAVKVGGRWAGAAALGVLLRARLGLPAPSSSLAWSWVPAMPRRRRARGIDLPEELAGPGAVRLLRRVRQGPDQTDLPPEARRRGPVGAFRAAGPAPASVVLVDDVRTTGGTARAAAAALRTAGARRVLVVTFAVAGEEAIARVAGRPPVAG